MEWTKEILFELVFACLGVVLTAVTTWLGTLLGKLWKENADEAWLRELASTCVQAVEQMYRDQNGEEKLKHALELCEELAAERGIELSAERIRVFLEAALGEAKNSFREVAKQ